MKVHIITFKLIPNLSFRNKKVLNLYIFLLSARPTNAAYIAAMQCVCCSFYIIFRTKTLRWVIVRISTGTVHATNLVAYSYRYKFGSGLVLEHQTCSNLSSRGSMHREWRHMLPSTPPAKFHQEMLSCPQIYLPH